MSKQLQPIKAYAVEKKLVPNWTKPFPVNGQGVLIFNIQRNNPFAIVVKTKDVDNEWIALDVQDTFASFSICSDDKSPNGLVSPLLTVSDSADKNVGYESDKKISYWFSYDRDNLVLKYGKGYRMEETTLMKYDFLYEVPPEDQEQVRKEYYNYFNPEVKKICEQYDIPPEPTPNKAAKSYHGEPAAKSKKIVRPAELDPSSLIDIEGMVEFDLNPLICNRPFLVKDSSENNLFLLDEGDYTFSASLPAGCHVLYENVKNCELDWPEEVESVLLSDSIRYSINTPGCILYEKLKEKATEFGDPNPDQTYLRVTLGNSLGKSPGIPYVLELWPSGHYSPIHNHGNANAVIKILFGTIHIQIYNKHVMQDDDDEIILQFDGKAGDVTWLDRNWYQSHKLVNISDDFCATIQCYNYATADLTHWPYFDYVSDTSTIDEFLPNSDFSFREMRKQVMDEYKASLIKTQRAKVQPKSKRSKKLSYWSR